MLHRIWYNNGCISFDQKSGLPHAPVLDSDHEKIVQKTESSWASLPPALYISGTCWTCGNFWIQYPALDISSMNFCSRFLSAHDVWVPLMSSGKGFFSAVTQNTELPAAGSLSLPHAGFVCRPCSLYGEEQGIIDPYSPFCVPLRGLCAVVISQPGGSWCSQ